MKHVIAWLGGALLAASAAAQTPPAGGPPDPQARFEHIAGELKLSAAQKPKLRQAMDAERTELMASMRKEREDHVDVMQAHQNHQKIEQAMIDRLKPVLSAEQLTKFQGILQAEADARHRRERAAAPPPAN